MKTFNRKLIVFILISLLLLTSGVYAADALYRFMHNDHDALILGEIISINGDNTKVRVEKCIISGKDLNANQQKKQLKLTEANIISSFGYQFFHNQGGNKIIEPSAGDYVLISLVKSGSGFKVAWGAYKVDSLDYKNLSVVLPEYASMWSKMDAAAIKAFVNSDGQITEFSFNGDDKTVRSGEKINFDGSNEGAENAEPQDTVNISEDINKTEQSSAMGIIGGADGPTSIFISGSPLKALIVPIVGTAVLIFTAGFAVGYIFKAKRYK